MLYCIKVIYTKGCILWYTCVTALNKATTSKDTTLNITFIHYLKLEEDYIQLDKRLLSELEETLYINSTLHELVLDIESHIFSIPSFSADVADLINSVFKRVTRNKSIQKFSLECNYYSEWIDCTLRKVVHDKLVKHLLRDIHTIQVLKMNIADSLLLDIMKIPLAALKIKSQRLYYQQTSILFSHHIKGLHCLILDHRLYSASLSLYISMSF